MCAHASEEEEKQKEIVHNNHNFQPRYSLFLMHPNLVLFYSSM